MKTWQLAIVCAVTVTLRCASAADPDPGETTTKGPELVCDENYTMYPMPATATSSSSCYRYTKSLRKAFDEARADCADDGADLVSIHNAFENAFVNSFNPNGLMIGFRDVDRDKTYTWSDGSPVDFNSSVNGFVDMAPYKGYCTQMIKSKWDNLRCDTQMEFVCKKNPRNPEEATKCPDSNTWYMTSPGTILSPGYPDEYDLSYEPDECVYKLLALLDRKIKLTFAEVNLTNDEGWIYVYKDWEDEFELAQVNNYFYGHSIFLDSNMVLLKLVASPEGRWKIKYSFETTDITVTNTATCPDPYLVYPEEGVLLSPGYPDYFSFPGSAALCQYKIAVKDDQHVQLSFDELYLKNNAGYIHLFKKWAPAPTESPDSQYSNYQQGKTVVIDASRIMLRINAASGMFRIRFAAVPAEL